MIYFIIIMFFQILLVCITLFILYRFVWRPWKLQKHYVKQFKAKNYRVLEIPFRPFQIGFLKVYDMSEDPIDSFKWCKEHYPNYDVVVLTNLDVVYIDFIHPDFQKEIFSPNLINNFPKE